MKHFKSETKYTTKSGLKLEIQTANYPVNIKGRDIEETEFSVELNVKDSVKEEITLESLFTAEFDEENNTITISADDDDRVKNVKINLLVPEKTTLDLTTENAPLKVKYLQGKQHIKSENGPMTLSEISGEIICETENGPIKAGELNGKIDINAENGPIALKEFKGSIHINTENSPVKLKRCEGTLHSKTENGPVRITEAKFTKADITAENGTIYYEFTQCDKGDFNFQNENGKIHVIVPEEIQYKIDAENHYGSFHIGLGGDYERKNEEGIHKISMIKGDGNVVISIKNDNGSINIVKDPLKRTKHFGFEMPDVSKIMDEAMSKIPDEVDMTKINEGMERAKRAMANINIPDVNAIVQNALSGIKSEIEDNKEMHSDLAVKVQEKVNKAMEKIKVKFENTELSGHQQKEVDERSRLKILQMLQDGKITADEAERLLKAMEK